MKQIPFVGLLAVATLSLALACEGGGGGPSSPLEEYFRALDAAVDESAERTQEATIRFEEEVNAASTDGELVGAARGFFIAISAVSEDDVSGLERIDPPGSVRETHERLLDAITQEGMVIRDLLDAIADAQSFDEIAAVQAEFDPAGLEAVERVTDACSDLNDIADENDIDVELKCQGGGLASR